MMFPLCQWPIFGLFCVEKWSAYILDLTLNDPVSLCRHLDAPLSHQRQVVAAAEALLQEERGAAAAHLPVGDDGDAIPQDVRLVHVVCGQDDGAA